MYDFIRSTDSMTAHEFEDACRRTVRTFGKVNDRPISVTFHGDRAYTDGGHVNLPDLGGTTLLTSVQVAITRGYLDHEAGGHLKHTDLGAYQKAAKKAIDAGDTLFPALLNCIEDMRVEPLIFKDYPGALRNISATAECVNRQFIEAATANPEITKSASSVGAIAVTWAGRRQAGSMTSTNEECLAMIPKELADRAEVWAKAAISCRHTQDAIDLAWALNEQIRKEENLPPPPMPQPKGNKDGKKKIEQVLKMTEVPPKQKQDDQKGKEGDSSGDPVNGKPGNSGDGEEQKGGDGKKDGNDPADGNDPKDGKDPADGNDPKDGNDPADGNDPNDGSDPKDGDSKKDIYDTTRGDAPDQSAAPKSITPYDPTLDVSKVLTSATNGEFRYTVLCKEADEIVRSGCRSQGLLAVMTQTRGSASYLAVKNKLSSSIAAMNRRLKTALKSFTMSRSSSGYDEGRLDTARLVGAYNLEENVFIQNEAGKDIDTAVLVLADLSASMLHQGKSEALMDTLVCLTEALEGTGCAYQIVGFNERVSSRYGWETELKKKARKSGGVFGRVEPTKLYELKAFGERFGTARTKIGNANRLISGSTNDTEAVLEATLMLKARRENRKVLIVLSDGEPGYHSDFSYAPCGETLRNAIEAATKSKIEVVGVGILSKAVMHYYPKNIVVSSSADLSGKFVDLLADLLLGKKVSVDKQLLAASRM